MKKLAIIVPYRDRQSHLDVFVPYMETYLTDYEYKIFVVEQSDNKPFNRGKLLNIGAKLAIREGFDYLALHDVDMLPLKGVDYSYPDTPIHLAGVVNNEQPFDDYFGGVTLFNVDDFKIINGYSNEYWGWGFEDDDMLQRCIQKNLPLETAKYGIPEKEFLINYFRFDGSNSFIKIPYKNLLSTFVGDFTISIKCKPEECKIDETADFDEYYLTSIPGRNTGLSYTSFKRYKAELWTNDDTSTSIQSDIIGEVWSHLVMTKEDDTLSFYMNGALIGTEKLTDQIFAYNSQYFYIGVGNPTSENDKFFFKGLISEFAIWNISLDLDNVKEIYENSFVKSLLNDYRKYNKSKYLKCYYDFKNFKQGILIDLSDNKNNAFIIECEDNYLINKFETDITIPVRRNGKFKTLKHNSNSTIGNKWIHYETRKNQTRFYNDMKGNIINLNIDGLNTCRYIQLETEDISNKAVKIKVEL
jgi:hypothetical protein